MTEERRRFLRVSSRDVACEVSVDGRRFPSKLIDESIEGLRIGDVQLEQLEMNQSLTVYIDDAKVPGYARSIRRQARTNLFELGIMRGTAPSEKDQRWLLLGNFLKLKGSLLICRIIEYVDDRCRIRLPDGEIFSISKTNMIALTEHERRLQLKNPEHFTIVTEFYRSLIPDRQVDTVDTIVAMEFGDLFVEEVPTV